MHVRDPYDRLRPAMPTPRDEICSCTGHPPIKLMWALTENPIHCLDCNLEVDPTKLPLPDSLVESVAHWCTVVGAIQSLELDSGPYEAWARRELLDAASPVNLEGLELRVKLDEIRRCYYWFFQPEGDDEYVTPDDCPVCRQSMTAYDGGIFRQLTCEHCSVVIPGR